MFRAKQHSMRLKSLSDLTFVFLSVRESVAGRGIDNRRDVEGREHERKESERSRGGTSGKLERERSEKWAGKGSQRRRGGEVRGR